METRLEKNRITKVFPPGKCCEMREIMPSLLNRTEGAPFLAVVYSHYSWQFSSF